MPTQFKGILKLEHFRAKSARGLPLMQRRGRLFMYGTTLSQSCSIFTN